MHRRKVISRVATNTYKRLLDHDHRGKYGCITIHIAHGWIHSYVDLKLHLDCSLHLVYLFPFLQRAEQHNVSGFELPDQLPHIIPGRLQWRLGSHKPTSLGVALQRHKSMHGTVLTASAPQITVCARAHVFVRVVCVCVSTHCHHGGIDIISSITSR